MARGYAVLALVAASLIARGLADQACSGYGGSNCATNGCSDLDASKCATCETNYAPDATGSECYLVSGVSGTCVEASADNTCTECTAGEFLADATTCTACAGAGCTGTQYQATTCDTTANVDDTCAECSTIDGNCEACSDASTCTQCGSGYAIDNANAAQCIQTTGVTGACYKATDASTCVECESTAFLADAATCTACTGSGSCGADQWEDESTCSTTSNVGASCIDCSTIDANCDECSDGVGGATCDSCADDYYLDSGTGLCVACTADGACAKGEYWTDTCDGDTSSDANCVSCADPTPCQDDEYFVDCDGTGSSDTAACVVCDDVVTNCDACSSASDGTDDGSDFTCTSCLASGGTGGNINDEGFYLADSQTCTACSLSGCEADEYQNNECDHDGNQDYTCEACSVPMANCDACASATVCDDCEENYYGDGTGACTACNLANCGDCKCDPNGDCDDAPICTFCDDGYYKPFANTQLCEVCTVCDNSFQYDTGLGCQYNTANGAGELTDDQNSICANCHESCDGCQGASTACLACADGWLDVDEHGDAGATFTCEMECANDNCKTCHGDGDDETCSDCRNSHFFDADTNDCIADCGDNRVGMYPDEGDEALGQLGTCEDCADANCKDCDDTGADACTVCSGSKLLEEGLCVDACASGYFQSTDPDLNGEGGECTLCADSDCDVCTVGSAGAVCTTCKNSMYLQDDACVADCGDGARISTDHTAGVGGECEYCDDTTNCKDCDADGSACEVCRNGFLLDAGVCKSECDADAYVSTAADGVTGFGGECTDCSSNCNFCTDLTGDCTECEELYYADGSGGCVLCDDDDAAAGSDASCDAIAGIPGQYFDDACANVGSTVNAACQNCIANCDDCQDGTVCDNCAAGFFFGDADDESCVACMDEGDCDTDVEIAKPCQYDDTHDDAECVACPADDCDAPLQKFVYGLSPGGNDITINLGLSAYLDHDDDDVSWSLDDSAEFGAGAAAELDADGDGFDSATLSVTKPGTHEVSAAGDRFDKTAAIRRTFRVRVVEISDAEVTVVEGQGPEAVDGEDGEGGATPTVYQGGDIEISWAGVNLGEFAKVRVEVCFVGVDDGACHDVDGLIPAWQHDGETGYVGDYDDLADQVGFVGFTMPATAELGEWVATVTLANANGGTTSTAASFDVAFGFNKDVSEWGECSSDCGAGTQTRTATCTDLLTGFIVPLAKCGSEATPLSRACIDLPACPDPKWVVTSEYSACDAACGGGQQTRTVECVGEQFDGEGEVTATCDEAEKPATVKSCNTFACATYNWVPGQYGKCTQNCGTTGVQNRLVKCRNSLTGVAVAASNCDAGTKPATQQNCNRISCGSPYYVLGSWTTCSVRCGGGVATRSVECYQDDDGDELTPPALVANSVCAGVHGAQPTERTCNTGSCHVIVASPWSACSAACGPTGTKTRTTTCYAQGGVVVNMDNCVAEMPLGSRKAPAVTAPCNRQKCPGNKCDDPLYCITGVCAPATETCTCPQGYAGTRCETSFECPVPGAIKDAANACCNSGVVDGNNLCCDDATGSGIGVLDGEGNCCPSGQVDGCGVCDGTGKFVDPRGVCCKGATAARDAGGLCCVSGDIDDCGVCDGDSNCAYDATLSVDLSGDPDDLASEGVFDNWIEALRAALGLDATWDISLQVEGSRRRELSGRALAAAQIKARILPGSGTQAEPDFANSLASALETTDAGDAIDVDSVSEVERAAICGNSICETGERCTAQNELTCCVADCPYPQFQCPEAEGQTSDCGGHGICDETAGVCECFSAQGYEGETCTQCAVGYRPRGDGRCTRDVRAPCVPGRYRAEDGSCPKCNKACDTCTGPTAADCVECSSDPEYARDTGDEDGECKIVCAAGLTRTATGECVRIITGPGAGQQTGNFTRNIDESDAGTGARESIAALAVIGIIGFLAYMGFQLGGSSGGKKKSSGGSAAAETGVEMTAQ